MALERGHPDKLVSRRARRRLSHAPYLFSESEVRPLGFEGGMIVGISQGVPYKSEWIQLRPGEGLFLFTDGLTEATNEAQDLYSEERLEATLRSCAAQPLQSLLASVTEDARRRCPLRPTISQS